MNKSVVLPNYKLQCVKTATHQAPEPIFQFMKDFQSMREVNCYFWIIRSEDLTILVDTGMGGIYNNPFPELACQHESSFIVADGEDTISQLQRFHLNSEDIDIIIISHLHYDHIANLPLFNNGVTKIIINKKGWEFANHETHPTLNPFPIMLIDFVKNEMKDQLYLCKDEEEVAPGISVIWTGGHTMCSQAVKIETSQGIVILTGDVAYVYDNIESNHPIGLAFNLYEAVHAINRLKTMGDILLPGHDKEILTRYPGGTII